MARIVSLPNPGSDGNPKFLNSDDPSLINRFIEAETRAGRGIFDILNPLKPGTTVHGKENIAAIEYLFFDIDGKDVVEGLAEVDSLLITKVPLTPTMLHDSGHGRHVIYQLKEPIVRGDPDYDALCAMHGQLVDYFGADPAVQPWSLLRRPGTLNNKREPFVACQALSIAAVVDLTEMRDFVEMVAGAVLITRKQPATDGYDKTVAEISAPEHKPPIDADERLAAMRWRGAGDSSVHATQLSVTAAMLRQGISLTETTRTVLDATRHAVADDPAAAQWDWRREELRILRMCTDFIAKNLELVTLLPDAWRAPFAARLARGRCPDVGFNEGGFYIRSRQGEAPHKTAGTAGTVAAADGATRRRKPSYINAKPFTRFDPASLPCREWLYGGHYQRGIITATVGTGGGGKSSLDLVELIAMCTGRNLLGEQPLSRCKAWYHNAEDGIDEIYRRIAAICQHYSIDQSELEGWLFVTSGIEMPIKIAASHGGKVMIDGATVEAIIHTIAENEICVSSFDPLIAHHNSIENATGDMDQVCREFARIANVTDCAIEIVHHTRKPAPGQEELSVTDSRGAGAIINAVRSARVLNTMSKAEADKAGIDDVDRRLHFRIDSGKANMAPPTAARWRKFASVELPNTDNVGVVTEWAYPTTKAADLPDAICTQIQTEVVKKEYRVAAQSPDWIGNLVAQVFCLDLTTTAGKAATGRYLAALFTKRAITTGEGTTGRHKVKVVVPGTWRPV